MWLTSISRRSFRGAPPTATRHTNKAIIIVCILTLYPGRKEEKEKWHMAFVFFVSSLWFLHRLALWGQTTMRDSTHVLEQRLLGFLRVLAMSVMCFTGCCIAEKGNIDLIWERAAVSQSAGGTEKLTDTQRETPLKAYGCQKCDPPWRHRPIVGDGFPFVSFLLVCSYWTTPKWSSPV